MTTNSNTNDDEFPPLTPSPKTSKSPTPGQESQGDNSAWTTVSGKTKKSPSPKKTGRLPSKSKSYKTALTVKGDRSPKRPKPPPPTPQGTAAVRKLTPGVKIKWTRDDG